MDEAWTRPGPVRKRMVRKLRVLLLRREHWYEWGRDGLLIEGNIRSDEEDLELSTERRPGSHRGIE